MLCTASHAVQMRREPGQNISPYLIPPDPDNPALWTVSPYVAFTRGAAPGAYALSDIPRFGNIKFPLILVEFNDLGFSIPDKQELLKRFQDKYNTHGYTEKEKYTYKDYQFDGAYGSVSDYFEAQSYGQFTPEFDIIGPIKLSCSYKYYGQGGNDVNVPQLIREVCDSIVKHDPTYLSGFARNGIIDQLSIVYAGHGENYAGSDPNTIWPHASILYLSPDKDSDKKIYSTGVSQINYLCVCELFWDSDTILDGIGTFCHEFSHTLGLPDFYNTDQNTGNDVNINEAMGSWSLMDYGCYDNQGFSPVGYTAFEKYSLGWLDFEEITNPGQYQLNHIGIKPNPDEDIHCAYRLNTGDDSQFIILENHRRTGWYKYHYASGLMVTAVDYDFDNWDHNSVNQSKKRYRILPADNLSDLVTLSGDLFPYEYSESEEEHVVDSITTRGAPQLKAGSSYPPYSVYSIKKDGKLITFKVSYDFPSNVENVKQNEKTVTVYDISGKPVLKTKTSDPEHITLPGPGIWIIKYGDTVRKVSL